MVQIHIELLPALLGVGTFVVYKLVVWLATLTRTKGNAKAKVSVDNLSFDENVSIVDSSCAEPDQEPCPVAEVHFQPPELCQNERVPRLLLRVAGAMFVLLAVAAACTAFHLQQNVQVSTVGGSVAPECGHLDRPGCRTLLPHCKWIMAAGACLPANVSLNVLQMKAPLKHPRFENLEIATWVDPPRLHDEVLSVKLTKQRVEDEQADEDFVRSAYYGTLMVGNPPEPFTVVFDTGSGHLVLPSTYCKSETCRVHRRYRRSASTTGKDINHNGVEIAPGAMRDQISVSYGTGEVSGVFVEDVVCVEPREDTSVTNMTKPEVLEEGNSLPKGCVNLRFIAATELSEDPFKDFGFDGIIGLGMAGLAQTPAFNFLEVVATQVNAWGGSAPHTFAVFLANNAVEDSEIALGGWSPKHLTEDLSWNAVPDPEMGHWLVSVHSIRADGKKLPFCDDGTCKAAVDTGTSLLAVPTVIFPELYELLRHPAPLAGHCIGAGPLLHFELDEITVTLGPRDYARAEKTGYKNLRPRFAPKPPAPTHRRDLRCNPMLMTLDLPEPLGPKLFILGEPILRKYYTAYDGKGKRIGFGRARHLVAPSRDELLIMAGAEGPGVRAPTMFDVFRWRKTYR